MSDDVTSTSIIRIESQARQAEIPNLDLTSKNHVSYHQRLLCPSKRLSDYKYFHHWPIQNSPKCYRGKLRRGRRSRWEQGVFCPPSLPRPRYLTTRRDGEEGRYLTSSFSALFPKPWLHGSKSSDTAYQIADIMEMTQYYPWVTDLVICSRSPFLRERSGLRRTLGRRCRHLNTG